MVAEGGKNPVFYGKGYPYTLGKGFSKAFPAATFGVSPWGWW